MWLAKLRLDTAGEEDEGKKEEGENAKNEGARRMRDMRKSMLRTKGEGRRR